MSRLSTLAGALVLLALASPAAARTWKQDWPVGTHPRIHVDTNDAHVRVHAGAPGQVHAVVEYTVRVWGLHSDVREPQVRFERGADSVSISARSRSNLFVFGGLSEQFTIDVTLPPECDLRVRCGDGGVELEPVAGAIDVETGDGHIRAQGTRGRVRLWTGDGGIDADGVDGDLTAHTNDGHLRIRGRFDRLDLHTGDGGIEASALRGSALAGPWSVTSGDGRVLVRIPRNLAALLDASTGDGHLHVELPIALSGEVDHHALRGSLNGGTVPLRVRTADGSITLALSE
jgi:hypothetical protein